MGAGETITLFELDLRRVLDRTVAVAEWWDGGRGGYRRLSAADRSGMQNESQRLLGIALRGPLELDCFCSSLPCHGDVIRRVLEETAAGPPRA